MENNFSESACPRFSDRRKVFPCSDLTDRILAAAVQVHRRLGPGFLERMYENALCLEFSTRELAFKRQVSVRVLYEETEIGLHRLDLVVQSAVVVEVKAIKDIEDVHLATVLSYLKATKLEVGLIINFAAARLRIRRVVRSAHWNTDAQTSEHAEGNLF
jgi:GxxExxY protein